MKKIVSFVITAILFAGLFVYAVADDLIQAKIVQHPIKVDGAEISHNFQMVNIEDRIYLPLRALCDVLGIKIDWNEQAREVEIIFNTDTDKVAIGYDGIENWDMVDLELTKDDALKIAEIVFAQKFDNDFIAKTVVDVRESEDKKAFCVFRYQEEVLGGDYTIVIRKSDGKILAIVAGE